MTRCFGIESHYPTWMPAEDALEPSDTPLPAPDETRARRDSEDGLLPDVAAGAALSLGAFTGFVLGGKFEPGNTTASLAVLVAVLAAWNALSALLDELEKHEPYDRAWDGWVRLSGFIKITVNAGTLAYLVALWLWPR